MALNNSSSRLILALILAAASHTPAVAQSDSQGAETSHAPLGDIVVTARRRVERLQETPIAISAFNAAAIEQRSVSDVAGLVETAPNVTFDTTAPISGSSNAAAVFIRGIGQIDFAVATDPGVGIYLDGVYIARSVGGVLDLADVERVEVLRGPQGTLFGKNTIGGAISVTTKRPDFDAMSFNGDATVGSYSRFDLKGTVNLPVSDNLAVRLSGSRNRRDGYGKRLLTGQELGGLNNYTLRGAVRWKATPDIEINLAADYTHGGEESPVSALRSGSRTAALGGPLTRFGGLLYNNLIVNQLTGLAPCQTPGSGAPQFCGDSVSVPGVGVVAKLYGVPTLPVGTVPYDSRWISPDIYSSYGTGPTGSQYEIYGIQGTLAWDLGGATVKSISAYRNISSQYGRDPDGSPITIIHTTNDTRQHQFSQELQLSGSAFGDQLKWLLGAYYMDERATDAVSVPFAGSTFDILAQTGGGCTLYPALTGAPSPIPLPVCPNIYGVTSVGSGVVVKNETLAFFGEATYRLTDTVSLTGGLRWTQDKKFIDISNYLSGGAPVFTVSPTGKRTFRDATPRVILDWKPSRDMMLYASYSEGFKSGGFNQRYGAPLPSPTSYDPEQVRSFEVGGKVEILDRRLRLNAAAFTTDYSNIQTVVFDLGIPRNINAAKGRIRGFELEATAVPIDSVTLGVSYGYLDAQYRRLDAAIIGSFGQPVVNPIQLGYRFVNTPKHNVSGYAEYRVALAHAGSVTLRGDASLRSAVFNDAVNTPELRQSSVTLLNARITYRTPNERWSLALFGTNLTNRAYITSGVADEAGFGQVEVNAARKREWGVSLGARF